MKLKIGDRVWVLAKIEDIDDGERCRYGKGCSHTGVAVKLYDPSSQRSDIFYTTLSRVRRKEKA